jgi:hypothetical protein
MADGGFLPSEIDEFTLCDVNRIFSYWGEHPPTSWILAAVHGIKTKPANEKPRYDPSSQASPAMQAMIARNKAFMEKNGIRIAK